MRVLHSGSLDVKSGGPALSTYLTLKGLTGCGVEAEIIMPPLDKDGKLIATDAQVRYTNRIVLRRFGYMAGVRRLLSRLPLYDIYHVQGCWQHLGHTVAAFARSKGRPYVLTPRGMLYPQALAVSARVKKVSLRLYQGKDLREASCIQATCTEEMEHYRRLGFSNPVAVIPNPIDITGIVDREIPHKTTFRIGYLGRIHPRKRIERLIYAMDELREKLTDVELVVIGAGDETYEKFLREEAERLKLRNVTFTGFLTGEAKDEAIMGLSLLVVPSDFENFGNIVPEALVRGVPVVASKGMPWQELEEYHCGWWVSNEQESINETILKAWSLTAEEREQMGMNGKRLMRENYSVETLGRKMRRLYEWILDGGEKPEFVYD